MKNVPGVHLGIVINTDDPEKRGRVQVFVPNVSTTLYDNWNKDAVDITFSTASFKPNVLERLKSLLPWAEVSSAFWGGSTSAPQNETTGKPAPYPSESSADAENKNQSGKAQKSPTEYPENNGANNPDGKFDATKKEPNQPIQSLKDVPVNVLRYLMSIASVESGFSGKEASTNANNQVSNNGNVRDYYNKTGDLAKAQALYGDYGYTQYNYQNEVLGAKKYNVDLAWGTNTRLSQEMLGLAQYMQSGAFDKSVYQNAVDGKFSLVDQSAFGQKFKAIQPKLHPENQSTVANYRSASRDKLEGIIQSVDSGSGPGLIAARLSGLQNGQDQKVIRPTDLVDENGPADIGGRAGAPMGAVSTPTVNSKVWVFFLNENPNIPICFASVSDAITAVT